MKKRRIGLFLNIVTICLSVVAITIGVFSIKQASLGVNGSVGFVANECKVNISAYMYGYATTQDGYPIEKPTTDAEKHYLTYGSSNTEATESKPLMVYDNQNTGLSFNIGTGNGVYFSNMSATNVVEPITIVLTITNGTQNLILVEDKTTVATDAKYTVDCDNMATLLNYTQDNKSTTVTYTLMPAKDSAGKYVNIETMVNVSLSMNFSKIDTTNINTDNFTISGTTLTGVPTKAQTGSDILVIPSTIKGTACTTIINGWSQVKNIKDYRFIILLDGYTSLDGFAFQECSILEGIILPNSLSSISSNVFYNCTSLKSIIIPYGLKDIGANAFSGCTSLEKVVFPSSLTTINDSAFKGCTSLEKINFPDGLTTIGTSAFSGCINLGNFEIPTSVTMIKDGAFAGTKITKYKFLKNITYGSAVFTNLIEAELEDGFTSVGSSFFSDCTALTSVILPSTITSIQMTAFINCTSLKNITLPSSLTDISWRAFYNCSLLTSITIPSFVSSIATDAFTGCTSLTSVKFEFTTGWTYGNDSSSSDYKEFTSAELSNTSTAATYLTSTYKGNTWYNHNYYN